MPFFAAAEGETNAVNKSIDLKYDSVSPNLVIIKFIRNGEEHTSKGVIALMDDQPYLITNQRILLGADHLSFTTVSGEQVAPKSVELSTNSDLVRLALKDGGRGLKIATGCKMNTPVALIKNDRNPDKRIETGSVIGIGGTKFEISMQFGDDESGAPVLNAENDIVGIASYSRESMKHAMKTGTRFEDPRHFCSRVETCKWKPVNWRNYNLIYGISFQEYKAQGEEVIRVLKSSRDQHIVPSRARELATTCRMQSRKIEKLIDSPDLTIFLRNELEDHAELFEFGYKFFTDYAHNSE